MLEQDALPERDGRIEIRPHSRLLERRAARGSQDAEIAAEGFDHVTPRAPGEETHHAPGVQPFAGRVALMDAEQ